MVYYFHVRRIQNLMQMIMAQGFPAWAKEGTVGQLVLFGSFSSLFKTTVKEKKQKTKTKTKQKHLVPIALVLVVLGLRPNFCRSVTFMM